MACTACASECLCSVVGTDPITVTGTGSAADPYRVAVDLCGYITTLGAARPGVASDKLLAQDAAGNCATVLPIPETPFEGVAGTGILITPGGINGHMPIITATGNAVVPPGCGLKADGLGLAVNTSGTWNFACPDTEGAPIYCDAAGQLRTNPEHTCVAALRMGIFGPLGTVPGDNTAHFIPDGTITLNNPSPCRPMVAAIDFTVSVQAGGLPAGTPINATSASGQFKVSANSLIGGYTGTFGFNECNWNANQTVPQSTYFSNYANNDVGTISPGGSASISWSGGVLVNTGSLGACDIQSSASMWGCTQ